MRSLCSLDELRNASRIFVGEAFATFLVLSATILSQYVSTTNNSFVAFSVGAAVYTAIWVVGPVSGANINPMVTLANVALRRIPPQYLLLYWLGQLVGALLGFLFALEISHRAKQDPLAGITVPAPGVTDMEAFGCEIFMTFFLLTSVLSGLEELRPSDWNATSGVGMAMIVGVVTALMVGIGKPISGAGMNPTRSLVPALMLKHYRALWVYIVGPLLGTLAAIIVHEFIFCPDASLARLRALLTKREFSRHVAYKETTDADESPVSISSVTSRMSSIHLLCNQNLATKRICMQG
ncbi:unnamed protein product [Schistocephalus solidus]|uniref:Aquaporin n=1 Tax=Schistocephalus solidus TaxID=70667 RepID=A0A183T6G8_SCHSO|nr:unnamed protein product [Schistocephalus solidus]